MKEYVVYFARRRPGTFCRPSLRAIFKKTFHSLSELAKYVAENCVIFYPSGKTVGYDDRTVGLWDDRHLTIAERDIVINKINSLLKVKSDAEDAEKD